MGFTRWRVEGMDPTLKWDLGDSSTAITEPVIMNRMYRRYVCDHAIEWC